MSPPRRRAPHPLLAVLCACACLMAMLLLAHAAAESSDGPPSPRVTLAAELGSADSTAVEDGEVDDDDALDIATASALPCGRGMTPFATAPRAATAGTDPPQSPPPEA